MLQRTKRGFTALLNAAENKERGLQHCLMLQRTKRGFTEQCLSFVLKLHQGRMYKENFFSFAMHEVDVETEAEVTQKVMDQGQPEVTQK